MEYFSWNDQQIRLKSIKAQPFQRQRQIIRRRRHRCLESQAEDVDRPEIEVFHALPEESRGKWFPIVHGRFGGVFADDAVYYYLLFALGEPALLAAEPAGSCSWRGGHEHEGEETDDKCEKSLQGVS